MYAVVTIITNPSGQVLAVSRKDDPSDLGLPGGKIDEGETPIDAATREVFEETGLTVVLEEQPIYVGPAGSKLREVGCFTAKEFSGELRQEPGSNAVVKWVNWSEITNPSVSYWAYNYVASAWFRNKKVADDNTFF
jgi:8-oxo-dGTP pyrophosphatase MutT (NUDIX family)